MGSSADLSNWRCDKWSLTMSYFRHNEDMHEFWSIWCFSVIWCSWNGKSTKLVELVSNKHISSMSWMKFGYVGGKYVYFMTVNSGRRQLRAKIVKLTPNNRKLIKEILNYSVTLAKKLLLMNSSKIGRLSSRLILLMKKRPYLMSLLKIHNISSKMVLRTSCQNRASLSILIKPSLVCTKLRLIRSQMIIIICNKSFLLSTSSLLQDHRMSRHQRRRRAGKLAREKIQKSMSTHV
jgi:hypothetical protein